MKKASQKRTKPKLSDTDRLEIYCRREFSEIKAGVYDAVSKTANSLSSVGRRLYEIENTGNELNTATNRYTLSQVNALDHRTQEIQNEVNDLTNRIESMEQVMKRLPVTTPLPPKHYKFKSYPKMVNGVIIESRVASWILKIKDLFS